MGHKINPTGFRLAVTHNWTSRWYARGRTYQRVLVEDVKIRDFLMKKLRNASVSRIVIERPANSARITIFTARPGTVIGKSGADVDALKAELKNLTGVPVHINIEEIRRPELDAQLMADSITQQLEKRIMFRRAMKRAMQSAMRAGAKGVKIMSNGRLNGADIARSEWYREGRVPLHTLRANIDYGFSEALTTYGRIGVKVWVYRGEGAEAEAPQPEREDRRNRRAPGARRPGGRRNERNDRSEKSDAGENAGRRAPRRAPAAKDGE